MKDSCDVVHPILITEYDKIDEVNYAYVPKWSRYYFIDDITFTTGNRAEISMTVDVLATFKTDINNYTCFVERSGSNVDLMISDNLVSNGENIVYKNYVETDIGDDINSTGCYMIQTVGGASTGTGITSYITNKAGMLGFMQALFDPTKYNFLVDDVVKSFFNPFQYVISVKWLPIYMPALLGDPYTTANIWCGWWDTGEVAYIAKNEGVSNKREITLPSNLYNDFRKFDPRFSRYTVYLPAVGAISVSPADIANGLTCQFYIDSLTGYALYWLNSGNELIGTYKTQMGVPIQIGQLNSGALNMAASSVGAITSAAAGSIVGAGANLVDAAKSLFNPTMSINGVNGDMFTLKNKLNIGVSVECRGSGDKPNNQAGSPCYKNLRLGSLTGFVKCGNASVQLTGSIPYGDEVDMVNNFLNSGFYME